MGKGDKKSRRGKVWLGSYGNSRRKNVIKARLRRSLSSKPAVVEQSVEVADAKPKTKRTTKKKSETAE